MAEASMRTTRLIVRTPRTLVIDCRVRSVTAQDGSGRFGVRPGCEPLLAALVPSLLTYRNEGDSESILAVGHGVLQADAAEIRVAVREAIRCQSLESVGGEIHHNLRARQEGEAAMHEVFEKMYQKLLKGLIDKERLA